MKQYFASHNQAIEIVPHPTTIRVCPVYVRPFSWEECMRGHFPHRTFFYQKNNIVTHSYLTIQNTYMFIKNYVASPLKKYITLLFKTTFLYNIF